MIMTTNTYLELLLYTLVFLSFASAQLIAIPTYAPVPANAEGPPINTTTGYRLEALGEGAYMVTDGQYNNLFFVTPTSVIVVDAPPTIGRKLVYAIRSITSLPISHVVYSHSHGDHIGGAYLLGSPENVTFIAHKDTAVQLAAAPDSNRPFPTVTFEHSYTLKVGNQTLQLDYLGINHEPGNIFIYAPDQRILMLVDIVYPGWTPYDRLGEVQSVPGYIKAHDQILTYDFDHFVGGHINRWGTREDVLLNREFVHDLFNTCVTAITASGQPSNNGTNTLSNEATLPPVAKANPHSGWAVDKYYSDVLTEWVANETIARWKDRLYGMDVYGLSHAQVALEAVRLDWGIQGPFGVVG